MLKNTSGIWDRLQAINLALSIVSAVFYALMKLWGLIFPNQPKGIRMTPETMGVENIKEILDAVLDGVDLGKAVLADGKVDLGDVASLFGALPKIIADVSLAVKDGAMVVPEVKDLQPEELASLAAHVMGRLAVADAHAVKIVEASLKIVGDVVGLVKAIQG